MKRKGEVVYRAILDGERKFQPDEAESAVSYCLDIADSDAHAAKMIRDMMVQLGDSRHG